MAEPGRAFFAMLTQKRIRRGVFHSVNHLEAWLKIISRRTTRISSPWSGRKSATHMLQKMERVKLALAAAFSA